MIHIACAADAAYAAHAAAMMQSALARHPSAELHFHFLHGPQLPAAAIDALRATVAGRGAGITFHRIDDDEVAGLPEMGRISRVMWYRLFLPERLAGVERVLYLDCDTIVMDHLAPLWDMDLSGHDLAAAANVFLPEQARHLQSLGLVRYFNSGVLLLNLAAWRRGQIAARVLAHARSARLVWPDQDALNTTLAGRWRELHPRWNCQNSLFYFAAARATFGAAAVAEATRAPGILHFEGGELAKPWHYLCKHPFRGEYRRHRAATPFPPTPLEGRTLGNMLLRPLPTTWIVAAVRLKLLVQRKLRRWR